MFIEDTFQLSESCMGIRRQEILPTNAKICPKQHKDANGKIYFSATNEDITAKGKTEADAIRYLTLELLTLNRR